MRALPPLVLALAAGCGNNCPRPVFTSPTTVSGPAASATGHTVVVRWSPSAKDALPLDYYRQITLEGNGSPTPVRRVTLTAPRELTIKIEGLDAYLRGSKTLDVALGLPDTRDWVSCAHPGRPDTHHVTLKLSFSATSRAPSATFSPVYTERGAL